MFPSPHPPTHLPIAPTYLPLSTTCTHPPIHPPITKVTYLEPLQTDLLLSLLPRLASSIDVLLFNPPYVPTPTEEIGSTGIEASWAGGVDGREVLDRLLPLIPTLLSPRGGCMYLVAVQENRPEEILGRMRAAGLTAEVRCGGWVGGGGGDEGIVYSLMHLQPMYNTGGSDAQGQERGPLHSQVYPHGGPRSSSSFSSSSSSQMKRKE